jgi:hypothetical protein
MQHALQRTVVGLAAALAVATPAAASTEPPAESSDPTASEELRQLRRLTARYHDVAVAEADGFVPTADCVTSPDGTMGVHYISLERLGDGIVLEEPEILVYVPDGDWLRLVAVEYMQVDADQDLETDDDRPELFGTPFDGPMPGHDEGQPIHYDLHVWAWDHNPNGALAPWNPALGCPES